MPNENEIPKRLHSVSTTLQTKISQLIRGDAWDPIVAALKEAHDIGSGGTSPEDVEKLETTVSKQAAEIKDLKKTLDATNTHDEKLQKDLGIANEKIQDLQKQLKDAKKN